MTKKSISLTLRKLRENQKLTVREVQEQLMNSGISISVKTIYGWESGKRLPDANVFLILCDIYQSEDILSDFGYKSQSQPVLLAAHKRTDIEIPEDINTNEDDIFNDENF